MAFTICKKHIKLRKKMNNLNSFLFIILFTPFYISNADYLYNFFYK